MTLKLGNKFHEPIMCVSCGEEIFGNEKRVKVSDDEFIHPYCADFNE